MDIHKCGKVPSLTTRLHKNDVWQTWGVSLAGKIYDLLDSRAEAVLPFWSGTLATGLWAIWGGATGRSALQISSSPLPACTASLLASHLYTATLLRALQLPGRTNPNAMALSSFPGPCRHEPLPEKNVRRMLVYLSISLSIYLSIYLSICLSVYLTS